MSGLPSIFTYLRVVGPTNQSRVTSTTYANQPKFLCRDTVATWCAAEWPLATTLFNGDIASSPVPRLFAINPPEALAALTSDDARAFRDLQRIHGKFFTPENLPSHKTWNYLRNCR